MVGFDVGCNWGDVLKKSKVKMAKYAISRQFSRLVSVPNRGGTGTTYENAKWYRYHPKRYWYDGTGTTHQNMIGTGTNHSGTDTDTVQMSYHSP